MTVQSYCFRDKEGSKFWEICYQQTVSVRLIHGFNLIPSLGLYVCIYIYETYIHNHTWNVQKRNLQTLKSYPILTV